MHSDIRSFWRLGAHQMFRIRKQPGINAYNLFCYLRGDLWVPDCVRVESLLRCLLQETVSGETDTWLHLASWESLRYGVYLYPILVHPTRAICFCFCVCVCLVPVVCQAHCLVWWDASLILPICSSYPKRKYQSSDLGRRMRPQTTCGPLGELVLLNIDSHVSQCEWIWYWENLVCVCVMYL